MIPALCILLPPMLAASLPWMPGARWVWLGCAALDLVLAASLPWTGTSLGGWLLPDPLAVLVLVLAGFAWLMASAAAAATPALLALLVGLVNLALLADGAGLTAAAAGAAGIVAVYCLHGPGPLLAAAATGMGLAVFGTVVLYAGAAPALGPGWTGLSWSALPETGPAANGMALSTGFVLMLLGLGVSCILTPLWAALRTAALPPGLAMLAGPLGGVWLVAALRLRGVLDGNGHAVAPGGLLLAAGLVGLALAAACLRRPCGGLPAALLAMFAAVLCGFGVGGAAATGAGLLHLTLGCVALTAAATGSRLGLAALAGVPPFGLFASGFALVMQAAQRNVAVAGLLLLGLFGVAALALRRLPQAEPGARWGWVGIGLTLLGAWAMPPAVTAWIQGIAAAAR